MINDINSTLLQYHGLTSKEVNTSAVNNGTNYLEGSKKKTFLYDLLINFSDPIIKILLCALAINIVTLFKSFNIFESAGIVFAILLSTLISTISERGSENAFEKLNNENSKSLCKVKRNGHISKISCEELVVGDIIILNAGEQIPADCKILFGKLSVDQSALTGETKEKEKNTTDNSLYKGSVIYHGQAIAIVTAVGKNTYFGSLALSLTEKKRISPLKLRLSNLANQISKLGFAAAALVAFSSLFNSFVIDSGFDTATVLLKLKDIPFLLSELLRAFTLAITVIVVAVPEGLPMMITVVLSQNMKKMLKDNVLVRKLVGIETAGSLNILFTDKTGTITNGVMSLSNVVLGNCTVYDKKQIKKLGIYNILEKSIRSNTDCIISNSKVFGGNSTDRALFDSIAQKSKGNAKVVTKIPFESDYKFSAVKLSDGEWYIKGAPEIILNKVKYFYDEKGNITKLENPENLLKLLNDNAKSAVRTIAVAQSNKPILKNNIPDDLSLICLCGLKDKPRTNAKEAVKSLQSAGIQVVMITGDNIDTANSIAKECGILKQDGISLTSSQMEKMTDLELSKILPKLCVVARAFPKDKIRLVKISEQNGLVTGMTGDGINDSPALKSADVGFAMGSGTAVAKEASDIVITDNNINSIAKSVLYGRTIFKSIRKFITFQLTMNLCAVGISLIGPFLSIDTPVTVMQMLWINMIMDTLGGLAFAGEAPLSEYMEEAPKSRTCPIINSYMLTRILTMSFFTITLYILYFTLPYFKVLFGVGINNVKFMTVFFALFVFSGIFNCSNARTSRINILANLGKNKAFLLIMSGITVIQTLLVYFGGTVFRTCPLSLKDFTTVILLSFSVVPADIITKIVLKKLKIKNTI